MEFLNTHTFPLHRLMQVLSDKGFHITPDMYVRVQTILQQLGKQYHNQPEKLAHILAPVLAKNPQQQEVFYEVFEEYLKEYKEIEIEEVETSFDEKARPPIQKEWYRKPLIWLVFFGVLVFGILVYPLTPKPIQPIETTQPSSPIDTPKTIIDTTKVETPILPIDTLQAELQITVGEFLDRALKGHQDRVNTVTFSPNGKYLATASHDNTARIWSVENGKQVHALQGHQDWVRSVAFSPNGQYLATASFDNTARIWSVENGKQVHALQGHQDWVRSVAFSPNGQYLATASRNSTARIWSVENGKQVHALQGHQDFVRSVAFSPNGQYLATASKDNTARIWSVENGKQIHALQGHQDFVDAVAFSSNGQYLATASFDNTARIWSVENGKQVHALQGHQDFVDAVAFSSNGQYLATASFDNTARIWSVENGKQIHALQGHQDWVWSVAFSPNGQYLATASFDNTARIWSVENGKQIHALQGHQDDVWSVAFSPNGQYLATASFDKTARLWNVNSRVKEADLFHTQPTKKAYLYPLLLFLTLLGGFACLFNRLHKTKTPPFDPDNNTQAPYKIPFPEQAVIPATPQVYQLAKMLRQRQAGWRYRVDIPATVRATIAKGGFPVIRHRGNTRPPEYLFLIDLETPDAQQVRWLEYVLEMLRREEVLMACYYFKQDPSWCWNREQPDGLDIHELHRRFPDHRLVIYGDGDYWLDSFEARTDERVLRDFPLWSQRALLTTVPPENWSYRERLLQQYFNLIPGDMKEPLVLATALMTQPEDFEQIRQDRSRSTDRFIEFNSLDDIRDFLQAPRLVDWLAATTVYPEPQWEITLAVGKALEQITEYQGILTLPNLRRLTQIKWMNRDAFPENLRQDLLAHLHTRPQVATRARETVIGLLQEAQKDLPPDSYAHTDARIKIVEQQLNTPPVSPETEAKAQELIDQKLMHDNPKLSQKRSRRRFANIATAALTAALLTLILCSATLDIFPQITEKWDLVETVSFDLPIRIDDPRFTDAQDSLGVKIVSESYIEQTNGQITIQLEYKESILFFVTIAFIFLSLCVILIEYLARKVDTNRKNRFFVISVGLLIVNLFLIVFSFIQYKNLILFDKKTIKIENNFERAFNVMANEDYLVEGIPVEFLDSMATIQTVCENDSIRLDSFILAPTPVQRLEFGIKRRCDIPVDGFTIREGCLGCDDTIKVKFENAPIRHVGSIRLSCIDGIKNGDEIGIDCGGSCPPCNTESKIKSELSAILIPNDSSKCEAFIKLRPQPEGIINDFNGTNDASGIYPVGATMVTWTLTDSDGNATTHGQEVRVLDTEKPTMTCPLPIEIERPPGLDYATLDISLPVFKDNCSGDIIFSSTHNPQDTLWVGTTKVTYTITDVAGNKAFCTFNIDVK